jgi:hypothetical protein
MWGHPSLSFADKIQVFDILTKASLFTYESYDPYGLDAPSAHSWLMTGSTGENFILTNSKQASARAYILPSFVSGSVSLTPWSGMWN